MNYFFLHFFQMLVTATSPKYTLWTAAEVLLRAVTKLVLLKQLYFFFLLNIVGELSAYQWNWLCCDNMQFANLRAFVSFLPRISLSYIYLGMHHKWFSIRHRTTNLQTIIWARRETLPSALNFMKREINSKVSAYVCNLERLIGKSLNM